MKSRLVYQTKYRSQSTQFKLFRSISARSHSQRKTSIFYSDIRIFSGGFPAAKIRRRIRLADFFSADIRRTKIRRLIRIFGGGLGSTQPACINSSRYRNCVTVSCIAYSLVSIVLHESVISLVVYFDYQTGTTTRFARRVKQSSAVHKMSLGLKQRPLVVRCRDRTVMSPCKRLIVLL